MSVGVFIGSFFKKYYNLKKKKVDNLSISLQFRHKKMFRFIIKNYRYKLSLIPLILFICLVAFIDLLSY